MLDIAIIFSNILVMLQAMRMTFEMLPAKGSFLDPLHTPEDIGKLPAVIDTDKELKYVYDAIALTRSKLQREVPLIGFCGPCGLSSHT